MSEDSPFYAPNRKPPPPRKAVRGEPLWELRHENVTWSAELRFVGESWGWDAQLYRDGEFSMSHRFEMKAAAIGWANQQRGEIEKGWQE